MVKHGAVERLLSSIINIKKYGGNLEDVYLNLTGKNLREGLT
jgi:hypothetical protein